MNAAAISEELYDDVFHYFRYQSNRVSFVASLVYYLSFSLVTGNFSNPVLIGFSVFTCFFLPYFSIFSNYLEEELQLLTAKLSLGRLGRFCFQFLFNYLTFLLLIFGKIIDQNHLQAIGGLLGISFMSTLSSMGLQYAALSLSQREIGNKNFNIIFSLSLNIIITALSTVGGLSWPKVILSLLGLIMGGGVIIIGLLSDLRSEFFPKKGVGIFLGSFNPIRRVHLDLIREIFEERKLSKIYIQCTTFSSFYQKALQNGEIKLIESRKGVETYVKTENADLHVNYFPHGNIFYKYDLKRKLILSELKKDGLAEKVELLDMKNLYLNKGFYGVLKYIKKLHPAEPLHAIHGSNFNGMFLRGIIDECGWIYPKSVKIRKIKE